MFVFSKFAYIYIEHWYCWSVYHSCQCLLVKPFSQTLFTLLLVTFKLEDSEADDEDDRFVLKVCSHFGFQVSFMNLWWLLRRVAWWWLLPRYEQCVRVNMRNEFSNVANIQASCTFPDVVNMVLLQYIKINHLRLTYKLRSWAWFDSKYWAGTRIMFKIWYEKRSSSEKYGKFELVLAVYGSDVDVSLICISCW